MTFDWREYLDLADHLYNNCSAFSSKEACLRAAISRGYYAAFCTARNCARDHDGLSVSNNSKVHGDIRKHYRNSPDRKRQQVGNLLDRLRDYRNKADYDDTMEPLEGPLESYSQAALETTRKIVNLLRAIHSTP
jgi:uncharacterized protein (UPF0332 family)